MAKVVKIKKGLDIPMEGKVADERAALSLKARCAAVVPDDFPGYTWKCAVKEGETVKAGSPLLFAKENDQICLTSPVAGAVCEIHRGERRKIEYVAVKADDSDQSVKFDIPSDKDSLLNTLYRSGLFAMLRQRPFDIVPTFGIEPRDIFVTGFDSAPLATTMLTEKVAAKLEAGLKALSKLTAGKIYLSLPEGVTFDSKYAETVTISGPHPSGLVGTLIAATAPVNKGETVWTTDAVTVARIGHLFTEGTMSYATDIALTGAEVKNPQVISSTIGISMAELLEGRLKSNSDIRVISGNVLTGSKADPEKGFLRYPYRQVTVIPEGAEADEFMGWASLDPKKYSVKKTFPAFLRGLSKPFSFDARIKGGHRAFILSGEFDKVFPMDIYPEFLLKAIIAKDIEKMEQLGIYEVAPEDFALAEFVDTSKMELQKIVREGLDYLRKETM